MAHPLILSALLLCTPVIAQALAWNKDPKSYYLLTQTLLPSSYTGTKGTASIKSSQETYKTYLEYGITSEWMLIAEFSSTSVLDSITIDATQPYQWQGKMNLPYQQYNGKLGVSYQIAKEGNRALSAQIFYRPGSLLHRKGNQEYVKSSEEISIGITKGLSHTFNSISNIYMEIGYTPSIYYHTKIYSPETKINLGLNVKKLNFEIGVFNKLDAANIKETPYNIKADNMQQNFGYVATDINSLIKTKDHQNILALHFKTGFKINKTDEIEFGIYHHVKGESPARTVYGIGYILRG